jgi:hypothetical protein
MIVVVGAMNAFAQDEAPAVPSSSALGRPAPVAPVVAARFFELRTYHAAPGKLEALTARFRTFTDKLFVKHGIQVAGSWTPMDKDGKSKNELVYILAFPSKEAHDKDWKEFADDIEWQAIKADSERNGRLIEKVDSVFMTATDFSPIK